MPLWRAKRLIIFTIICREDVFVVTRLVTSCNSFWKVLSSIYTTLVTILLQVSKKRQPTSLQAHIWPPVATNWSVIIKANYLRSRQRSQPGGGDVHPNGFFWGGGWYTWYTLRLEGGSWHVLLGYYACPHSYWSPLCLGPGKWGLYKITSHPCRRPIFHPAITAKLVVSAISLQRPMRLWPLMKQTNIQTIFSPSIEYNTWSYMILDIRIEDISPFNLEIQQLQSLTSFATPRAQWSWHSLLIQPSEVKPWPMEVTRSEKKVSVKHANLDTQYQYHYDIFVHIVVACYCISRCFGRWISP